MRLALSLTGNLSLKPSGTSYGPELISNGTFTDATGWTLASGHTISGGKLNMATTSIVSSSILVPAFVIGRSYRVIYTVSNFVNGSVRLSLAGVVTTTRNANGTYIQTITATTNSGTVGVQNLTATTNLSFDDLSVQEIL